MRWLAAAAIACAASRAEANPALVLDRCTTFDPTALRDAIQRELAASRPDPRRDELILAVSCADAVTARLSISTRPPSPTGSPDGRSGDLPPPALPLGRSLDLGEVPSELRIKLLATAAVELLDGAVASLQPPPPPVETGASTQLTEEPARRAEQRTAAIPPELPREDRPPSTVVRRSDNALVPRLGVRIYPQTPVPLAHLSLEHDRRWFSIGLSASTGSADVAIGSVTAYLVTATASTRPLCAGGATRGCIRARGELGYARARARASDPQVVARDAGSLYSQLGLSAELEHAFGSLAALLAVEGAWSRGLIATAQSETAIRLDGAVVTVLGGLRWRL